MLSNTAAHHKGHSRPARRHDLPQLRSMFAETFRSGRDDLIEDFTDYVKAVFLTPSPASSPVESQVFEEGDGTISAAILFLPMRFVAGGKPLPARLGCGFMSHSERSTRGAGILSLSMRASRQELCFSDTGSAASATLTKAAGGLVLPAQSLQWRRIFRPASFLLSRADRRYRRLPAGLFRPLARLADSLVAARKGRPAPAPCKPLTARQTSAEVFRTNALDLFRRFTVHPEWSAEEFHRLLELACLNKALGDLHVFELRGRDDDLAGACLAFVDGTGTANVFHLLSRPDADTSVAHAVLAHFDRIGCAAAKGMAQPHLVDAFASLPGITYRNRGHFCLLSRHQDVVAAAQSGTFYAGGLASEAWSRFVTEP